MRTNILYFTRTNETKNIAKKLGKAMDWSVYEITDEVSWYGPKGFLKGYWYSLLNKQMTLHYEDAALKADRLIIMSPLWLGGPTPAIKTLLDKLNHDNIIFVMTNHMTPVDRPLKTYMKKYPAIKGTYGITATKHNAQDVLEKMKSELG